MSTARTGVGEEMKHSFGFEEVGDGEKQEKVDQVFHHVAKRYDLMNDFMSVGIHRAWKQAMVAQLNPPKRNDWRSLDVAGGTGDIAFQIIEASGRKAHTTVLDINGSMLDVGRQRAEEKNILENLTFVEANAEAILKHIPHSNQSGGRIRPQGLGRGTAAAATTTDQTDSDGIAALRVSES